MFTKIKDWLFNSFVMGYVKGGLDKLPLDGYKTVISIIAYVLMLAIQALPQYAPFLQPIADILKPYAGPIEDVSIAGIITFLFHKLLKYIEPKPEEPKIVDVKAP